jgi:hypothetical protein
VFLVVVVGNNKLYTHLTGPDFLGMSSWDLGGDMCFFLLLLLE